MSDQDRTIPASRIKDSSHEPISEYQYQMIHSGDIIGQKYQIIKELGSGGFATSYLAVDTLTENNIKCVIKQLQPKFNSPYIWGNAKERLEKEGLILQKLGQHEQIPQLVEYFEENRQFYLVLEFIDGEDLAQEVQKKLLNEIEVIEFLQDILGILDFVHQQGVIHRDIKPSNIIRRKGDRKVFLIDFGAVKEIGTTILQSSLSSYTDDLYTQIIGTPGYMPPEQNNGKPVLSSDIYALGKTVIYALTGYSPTEWEQLEIDEAINWQDNVQISQGLIKLIQQMISTKTSERFLTTSQVIRALKPLFMVGKVLQERYSIVEYLDSQNIIDNYIVQDLKAQEYSLYFANKVNLLNSEQKLASQQQKAIQSFVDKSKILGKSSQVLAILDYFIEQDCHYLILEYVTGKKYLKLKNKLSIINKFGSNKQQRLIA